MPQLYRTQQHWEARANEARRTAEQITDLEAKRAMLEVAETYEKLAKRAEAQEAGVAMPANAKQEDEG